MKYLTYITLSKNPIEKEISSDMVYYNHVRTFSDLEELHENRLESIRNVQTPFFTFLDYDDDVFYPNLEFDKINKAVVYGDNHYIQFGVDRVIYSKEWSTMSHVCRPMLIHKAICNTDLSLKLIDKIPRGVYWTELLLFYSLALNGGYLYDKNLIIKWTKQSYGFHKTIDQAVKNSVLFLLNNSQRLLL